MQRVEDLVRCQDPDLLVDYRKLNGSEDKACFDAFWEIAAGIIDAKFAPRVGVL